MRDWVRPTLGLFVSIAALAPSDAVACGGCFSPPPLPMGTVSVVNAHRMAFLASPVESVLWDQIQYTGNPSEFVWVLPVMGNPTVEVGDNGFFEALVVATTIRMTGPAPPPAFCADPCATWGPRGGFSLGCSAPSSAFAAGDAGAGAPPVNVLHEGIVGPYETATIMSADPNALVAWLDAHGYMVPSAIEPTIAYYVGLGMNFVALRLRPRVGVDRMAPIRVRSRGLSLTLPLRMIAAGIGASVDLELFVFAESRMQTATFPNAEVDRAAITYDWATSTFDYDTHFEDALFRGAGTRTSWVTEYAAPPSVSALANYVSGTPTDIHRAAMDMAIVTRAIASPYLTRLRTRLTPRELDTDLVLEASRGAVVPTAFLVTRELNRRELVCDTYCAASNGSDPGGSTVRGTGRGYRCGAVPGVRGSASVLLTMFASALVFAYRRRRRS